MKSNLDKVTDYRQSQIPCPNFLSVWAPRHCAMMNHSWNFWPFFPFLPGHLLCSSHFPSYLCLFKIILPSEDRQCERYLVLKRNVCHQKGRGPERQTEVATYDSQCLHNWWFHSIVIFMLVPMLWAEETSKGTHSLSTRIHCKKQKQKASFGGSITV